MALTWIEEKCFAVTYWVFFSTSREGYLIRPSAIPNRIANEANYRSLRYLTLLRCLLSKTDQVILQDNTL